MLENQYLSSIIVDVFSTVTFMLSQKNINFTHMYSSLFQEFSILRKQKMERQLHKHSNKIQISQFGAEFLKQFSQDSINPTGSSDHLRQNLSDYNYRIKRRGEGIHFQQFANHTQILISHQLNKLFRVKTETSQVTQTKRKQILHHNNWINQQKLISNKLSDARARIQKWKYSEYDWRRQSSSFKNTKFDILRQWQTTNFTREQRLKSKIKTMMDKKYTKKIESGLIHLSIKKKLF